jgi:hypothetical protein
MEKNLRALAVVCATVPLMVSVLAAQQTKETIVDVVVLRVSGDTSAELLRRPQLRVSDGVTSILKIGNDELDTDAACASPLAKYSGTGSSLEITPRIHSSEEFTLHVVVSRHISLGCLEQPAVDQHKNELDVRLHAGEVKIVRVSSQLAIALVSQAPAPEENAK